MRNRLHEPVPVAPFLQWFDRQVEIVRRDRDAWPAVTGDKSYRKRRRGVKPAERGEVTYVLMQLGWPETTGGRRINRWRNLSTGLVERAVVEDALWRAGYAFEDVYECAGAEAGSTAAPAALEVAGPGTELRAA